MADKAAAAAVPSVVAPLIEISFTVDELTSVEVIHKINECVSHNQQIDLVMHFRDRFDATVAMENTIVRNSRHIKSLKFFDDCREKDEKNRCVNFCTKIVIGLIGKGKHLSYGSYKYDFELEQVNQLAQALLRLNSNNNGAIDSFYLYDMESKPEILKPVLDALLDSGVRKITFGNDRTLSTPINYNNSNIDFTGMKTNISLKELDLGGFDIRTDDCWNLFNSLKVNTGLEKLKLDYNSYNHLPTRMKRLFKQMLRENITLLDCRLVDGLGQDVEIDDPMFKMIPFHMKVNRMMKRYIMKRNAESIVAAVHITAAPVGASIGIGIGIGAGTSIGARVRARARASTTEANNNKKKWLKMRMLLNLFIHKPVLRDTMLFHLLRDYPDDLMDTDSHFRMDVHDRDDDDRGNNDRDDTCDMERDDDGDSESNNGTDDPDDSEGDSDTADGTDGIL